MSEDPAVYTAPHVASKAPYGEDYFLRGRELGLSNYSGYKWLPEQTLQHAIYVSRHLRMQTGDSLLDFGCARGYFVRAMRMMGYRAYGMDCSEWAIENCDPSVRSHVSNFIGDLPERYHWITAKDVFEHIPILELEGVVRMLSSRAEHGLLIIVPLTAYTGGKYIRPEDEMDSTHVNRFTLPDWLDFLNEHTEGFTVSGAYSIQGVKECCKPKEKACGFLTLTKL